MDHGGASQLVIRGLGRAELTLGALRLVPEAGMLFPLLLVLAQRAGERIPRATLIELVWPGSSEATGRHSLRQALYRLRKAGLRMEDRADDVRVDRTQVDSDLTRVLRHDWPYVADASDIEGAAVVLPGFVPDEGSALAVWYEQLRGRIVSQCRAAALHRLSMARREGRWAEVDQWALLCLEGDSLNEEATLARAEVAAMRGAKLRALEILDQYLRELGDRTKQIGLPARLLKRRISEMTDTTGRRVTATSAPFVGRHDLIARGQDTLALAKGGEAAVLWYVGPPGIGKSRLLREVSRAARMAGWCVVRGNSSPSHEDRPFALLTEILPQLLEAPGALGADPDALNLMRQMGRADTGEEPLAPEEVRGRQHAVYLSWVELMDAVLAEGPLALFVDDGQWSDAPTLLMLARFLESRPKARLAVILSARRIPTRDDTAGQRLLGATEARVGPLTEDEIRSFTLAAGLGGDPAFEEVQRRLGAASGGNPLFLGHLVHQHQMQRGQASMPADLATLIDEQMRGLSREAMRLLQTCALLGRHATLPRVERVLGVEAPALVSPFGELDDMLALPSEPGQSLAPHDLWTERVRHGMTAGVFRSLAVSTARVLEADAVADGGIELSWDAARLYQESGEKQLAYATMMRCAEYLMQAGDASEASKACSAAVDFASTPRAAFEALMGLVRAQQAEELWEALLETISRSRDLELTWTSDLLANLELTQLNASRLLGADDAKIVSRLRTLTTDDSLSPHLRLSSAVLGMAASDDLSDANGIRWFYRAAADVEEADTVKSLDRLRCHLIYETSVGDLRRAEVHAKRLIAWSRDSKDDALAIAGLRIAHYPPRRAGNRALALDRLNRAAAIAQRLKRTHAYAVLMDLVAGVYLDYGHPEEAIRFSHLVTDHETVLGGAFRRQSALDTRALAFCLLGNIDAAKELVAPPAVILANGRRRTEFMRLAATLLVGVADKESETIEICVDALDGVRDHLFRHSGTDLIALAYFAGLSYLRSRAAAHSFAKWYAHSARRDTLPMLPQLNAALQF